MKSNEKRKVPPLWHTATIEFAIRWMLNYFLCEQRHFRKNCIHLSEKFALTFDEENSSSFFKALFKSKSSEYIFKKFESMDKFKSPHNKDWMNLLEASLQAYTWLLNMNLINVEEYFAPGGVSNLFKAINHFLSVFSDFEISKDLFCLSSNLLNFLQIFLSIINNSNYISELIDNDNLRIFFVFASLQPFQLYLDVRNRKKVEKWLEKMKLVIGSMCTISRSLYLKEITISLSNYTFLNGLDKILNSSGKYLNLCEAEYLFSFLKLLSFIAPDFIVLNHSINFGLFQEIIKASGNEDNQKSQIKVVQSVVLDYLFTVENGMYIDKMISMLATKEMHFILNTHQKAILNNIFLHSDKLVPYLKKENSTFTLPVLLELLQYGIKYNVVERVIMVQVLVEQWCNVNPYVEFSPNDNQENLSRVIDLLLEMIVINNQICGHHLIFKFFCNLLASEILSIKFKNKIIPVLIHFYHNAMSNDDFSLIIVDKIKSFFDINFLALSKDLSSNILLNECYTNTISAIFQCLQIPCKILITVRLLQVILIPIFCRENKHPLEETLNNNMQSLCARLSTTDRVILLSTFEEELSLLKNFDNIFWFLNKFYLVIIFNCDSQSLNEFFGGRIYTLMGNLNALNNDNINEDQLQNMQINLEIITTIYKGLGPFINKDKVGLRESKLISELSRKCSLILYSKTISGLPDTINRLIYNVRSHAFNCFSTVVIATQSEEKFYVSLLLKANKPLFQHIIQQGYVVQFPSDILIQKMKKIKFFTLSTNKPIDNKFKQNSNQTVQEPIQSLSEFLSDSSLAFDVGKLESILTRHVTLKLANSESFVQNDNCCLLIIDIPDDVINNHICMTTFISLLHQMKDLDIISDTNSSTTIPSWMSLIHESFFGSDSYSDIKLFISKLILNCHSIFKPYATFWIPGLIDLITSTGSSINPFIANIISLIIDWSNVPGVIDSVSKTEINILINFVAENCYSENPSIARTNLELFSNLLNLWTSKVIIPYKPIFDNLQDIDKHIRNCCGLKMLAAVLTNGYPFMDGACNSVKFGFIKQLVKILRSKTKSVYSPAFELCGILLKKISNESDSNNNNKWFVEMTESIKSALEFVLSKSKSDFITCLSLIGKNCVEFICPQMLNLISILKSLPDDDLCKALELLGCGLRNSEEWSSLFKQLFEINIFEHIQFKSSSVICSLIQIMHQTVANLNDWKNSPEIKTTVIKCFEDCLPCCTHEEKNVRAIFYQLFIDLCTGEDLIFQNSFRSALLMGLIDTDKEISQSIRNFCSSSQYLPTGTLNRSHTILEILFPQTDLKNTNNGFLNRSKFLAIATNIILEMTSHSPDFIKPLFPNQLDSNVVFENLTAARMNSQTTRSLLPNFVNTAPYISSNLTSHDQLFRIPTSMNIPKKAKNFDWIKLASTLQFHNQDGNKSDDNYSMEWSSSQIPGVEMSLSLKSQKGFLSLKSSTDVDTEMEQNKDNQEIKEYNLVNATGNESFSTQEEISEYFRSKTIQKQKSTAKKLKIEKNIKSSSVFLYRNYQTGKLPDIQIQNSSIIAPIQMLAQLDDEFSKELFINLFNSLIKESESVVAADVFNGFCNKLSKCFNNILDTCTITDKNVISSCLEIAIENCSKIQLNPSYVYKACSLSGNEVLATILLEKYLTLSMNFLLPLSDDVPPVKRRKLTETNSVICIVSFLMKLYKFLNLNEEIIGLLHIDNLLTNSNLVDLFRRALEADHCGNYSLSYELYNNLLTNHSSKENENDFEYELLMVSQNGLIHSLKKLCKWKELSTFLDGVIEETTETQNFKVYKSMIHSKLRSSNHEIDREFDEVEKLDKLVVQFQTSFSNYELLMPIEMSLYEIVKENYHKAEKSCNIAYDKILAECRDYSLSGETDIKILQSLHLLQEMSQFLHAVDKNDQIDFIEIWKERNPDIINDSLEFWENLLFHRTVYMNKWKVKFPLFSERIDNYIHELHLQFVDVCINEKRFTPALNYLRFCKQKSYQIDSNSKLNWCLKYNKIHLKSAGCHGSVVSRNSVQDIIPKLVNSIKLLTKFSNIDHASFSSTWQYFLNLGDSYWSISNITRYHWSFLFDKTVVDSVFQLLGLVNNGFEELLVEHLSNKALDYLVKIIPLYYKTKCDKEKQQLSSALMVLSDFCDAQIVIYENVEPEKTVQKFSGIINSYVESTLLSMKLGEFCAKNKFPRLLQIIDQYGLQNIDLNHVRTIFSSIPSWMFISWIDQMMSYLDSGDNYIVESIIQRISTDYPHSLFYPFMLYMTNVVKKSNFTMKIEKALSSLTLMHQFYTALPLMGQPEDHLKTWLEEASEMFSTTDHNDSVRQNIVNKYKAMYSKFIGDFKSTESESGYSHRKSQFHYEFSKWFRNHIVENFQDDATCIYSLTQNQFSNIQRKIYQELNVWKSRMIDFKNLSEFSSFLAEYNIRDFHRENRNNLDWLEVPGQYNNITSRPFPEKHIKIFKFDQSVQIIPSKQHPKKIKIIGDNEQQYSFLVKSGEDLRQDFRIEQMFSVMNDIISRDHQLIRNLKSPIFVVTYNVIPISNTLGLLEWVDNTVTLRDFYIKTMKNDEQDAYKKFFEEYYSQFPSNISYIKSWEKPDVLNTNRIFEEYQKITSKFDLLRKSIMIISKNQESFYRMRIKFIQQYAMTVAAHYILGIGDRHLKNFLIDENTGSIIGIDFGYAFGMASIFLPIPELIPFRLTSTIIQFLKPSGVDGMFSQILDNVLATLSRDQLTIMSIMHVFLTNQIIDWHRMSRMNKQSVESFTQKRINISHRKLKREDPLLLLYEEIEIKHGKSNWLKCLKSFQVRNEEISQTKQLISMATNIGFLSRTWKGFEPLL